MALSKDARGQHLSLNTSPSVLSSSERGSQLSGGASRLALHDLDELRSAIERSLCEGELRDDLDTIIDDELRKAIRVACAKARLQRLGAEHVLIDVKQIWMTIPGMITTPRTKRLNLIVSACIDEYYTKNASSVL